MINVTCAIIVKDKKILVTQRSEIMKLPLKWEFPGGKIKENENGEECVLREIKEELNIEIEIVGRLTNSNYNYGDVEINLIPFLTKFISGELKLAEHLSACWFHKEDLKKLDWAAADIPIMKEFISLHND